MPQRKKKAKKHRSRKHRIRAYLSSGLYTLLLPELRHLEKLEEEQFTESDLASVKTLLHLPINSILKLGDSLPCVCEECLRRKEHGTRRKVSDGGPPQDCPFKIRNGLIRPLTTLTSNPSNQSVNVVPPPPPALPTISSSQ